jgi:hypothetical protein
LGPGYKVVLLPLLVAAANVTRNLAALGVGAGRRALESARVHGRVRVHVVGQRRLGTVHFAHRKPSTHR